MVKKFRTFGLAAAIVFHDVHFHLLIAGANPMNQSTRDLVAYLAQNGIKYAHRSDDEDLVMVGFTTRRVTLSLLFICQTNSVKLLCRLPFPTQPNQLDAVKDYFARVNYSLMIGCFELDVRDGETGFRIATFLTKESLSEDQVSRLMSTALGTVDKYIGGLQDVLFREVDPAKAANQAEELTGQDSVPPGVLVC
jgi:hypothetical protein